MDQTVAILALVVIILMLVAFIFGLIVAKKL